MVQRREICAAFKMEVFCFYEMEGIARRVYILYVKQIGTIDITDIREMIANGDKSDYEI
jgi:hypothetical protein